MADDPLKPATTSAATRQLAAQDAADTPAATAAPLPPSYAAVPGRDYQLGRNFFNPTRYRRYQRSSDDPLYRKLRIFTTDPVQSTYDGAESIIRVPYEPLELGPAGALLEVSDTDAGAGRSYPGVDLEAPAVLIDDGRRASPGDVYFHQQMTYAVVSDIIARFTEALGRELSWGFARPDAGCFDRLRIRPHHREERNAYYDGGSGELRFGYFAAGDDAGARGLPHGIVYTCLSQDIIAHETAHALLDGMRARFTDPTNPDVLAFHEGFADIIAILQHFTNRDSVRRAFEAGRGELDGRLIFAVASQFGWAAGAAGPLRIALDADADIKYSDAVTEPHARGLILVNAVLDAMSRVFERRVRPLRTMYALARQPGDALHPAYRDQLVDVAAKVAGQFTALVVRAIDYCPPVDISFGEFLRALITADSDLVEDDRFGYRDAIIAAFGARHIYPADVGDLSEISLRWLPPSRPLPLITALDMASIRFHADPGSSVDRTELQRQAQALATLVTDPDYRAEFGLSGDGMVVIESIRTIRRVGPDRAVRFGLVAEVLQARTQYVASQPVAMVGGATLIIGGSGDVRYVIRKALDRLDRARRQAAFQGAGVGRRQKADAGKSALWATLHRGGMD